MKNKEIKKLITPLASVIALVVAAFLGLSDTETVTLETNLAGIGTAILGILAVIGVWKNNDKDDNINS